MENPYRTGAEDGETQDPESVRKTRLFQLIVVVFAFYVLVGNGAFYWRVFAARTSLFDDGGIGGLFPYALTFALLTLLGVVLIALTFSYTFHRETMKQTVILTGGITLVTAILTYLFYSEIRTLWIALLLSPT